MGYRPAGNSSGFVNDDSKVPVMDDAYARKHNEIPTPLSGSLKGNSGSPVERNVTVLTMVGSMRCRPL